MNWNMIEDEWVESKIKTKRHTNKFNDDEIDYGKKNKKYDEQKHQATQKNSKNKPDKHLSDFQNVFSNITKAVKRYHVNFNESMVIEQEQVRLNDKSNSYSSPSNTNQFNKKRV